MLEFELKGLGFSFGCFLEFFFIYEYNGLGEYFFIWDMNVFVDFKKKRGGIWFKGRRVLWLGVKLF